MTITRLLSDIARIVGLAPALPAFAGHADRDPTPSAWWRTESASATAPIAKPLGEHFMNKTGSRPTMWRNSDETRPAPHHSERDRPGHRPRVTSGQRMAQALFDLAGPLARLVRHGETQWASATFTGARHTFVLRFQGALAVADAEALTLAISDDEVAIAGALIAEITVTRFTQTLLPEPEAEIEVSVLLLDQP